MPNLNAILKRKGITGVDEYIKELHYKDYIHISDKTCYKFVSNYLNHPFVYNPNYSFAIIIFIADIQFRLPSDFLDNIANTTYFKTMPKEYINRATSVACQSYFSYDHYCSFCTSLINGLNTEEDIKEFISHNPKESTLCKILAQKIVSFQDIDFIIEINPDLDQLINIHFDYYVPRNFSFEDTKKYLTYYKAGKYSCYIDGSINILENNEEAKNIPQEAKLDAYLDIVYNKINRYKDYVSEITISFIEDLLSCKRFTDYDYNYLASKILTKDNDKVALVWVCETYCSNNLAIIDKLITNNIKNLPIILETDNDDYLNYIVNKIPEDKINEFFSYLKKLANTNINIIDKVLDIILNKYPNYKLSTNPLSFELVKNGSNYAPIILQEKEFTKEERIDIYNSWLDLELELYLASFSNYLLNGFKKYIPTIEDFTSNKEMLLELKK